MDAIDLKADLEGAVATELREGWGHDDATVSALLDLANRSLEFTGSSLHEAVQLDAAGKGKSTSIRHAVTCNVGKALEAVAAFGVTVAGVLTKPWIGVIGFLLMVKRLRECLTVELDQTSGLVLWTMGRTQQETVASNTAADWNMKSVTKAVNAVLKARALSPLTEGQVWQALKGLEKLGVVDEYAKDKWQIVEVIRVHKA